MVQQIELAIRLPRPHEAQRRFIESAAKRKIIRAGRRGGKTVGLSILAVTRFLQGKRVLYAVPTQDQVDRFWFECKRALAEPIKQGVLYKNETEHIIEVPGTLQRIRAKTAWNADTLLGDYADLLILDEYHLMSEDAWEKVGAPMMLDTNGDAVFAFTPPSIRSRSISKARDKMHAAKLFRAKAKDESGRWECFHFTSLDNPHLSRAALEEIVIDMTRQRYNQEILAQDIEDNPNAAWNRDEIEAGRVIELPPLERIVIGLDPSATSGGDACGIVAAGRSTLAKVKHLYALEDATMQGAPKVWATKAIALRNKWKADAIVAEANNGGEMVSTVIHNIDPNVKVVLVHASRGKLTRAEPITVFYSPNEVFPLIRAHHFSGSNLAELEDQMCQWEPGMESPNNMDAYVWAATDLMLKPAGWVQGAQN